MPAAAATVTIAWDPNPEPDVVAYTVYWGTQPRTYQWSNRVAGVQCSLDGLEEGRTYYFAIQALSSSGLTSPLSEEVSARITATPILVSFASEVRLPGTVGRPISWTAAASLGSWEVEYKFFLFSRRTGEWTVLQDWGTTDAVSWTPAESGVYALQVWMRRVGSTATYEDWKSTGYFSVGGDPQVTSFDAQPAGPVRVGYPVTLTASVSGGVAPFEYQYWLLDIATNTWSLLGDYGPGDQVTFNPPKIGRYSIQVWVRRVGSTARFEAWASSGVIQATTTVSVASLTSNVAPPVATGTPVTWTAVAGGAPNIEYKFWLLNEATRQWTVLRDWESVGQIRWSPEDSGTYQLQVWAREVGSAADYASWRASGSFTVKAADRTLSVYALTSDRQLPVAAGTTLNFDAVAGGGVHPIQYQFWLYDGNLRSWNLLQDYSASARVTWTPSIPGAYALQVWARSADSNAQYDAWKGTGTFQVTGVTVSVSSLLPSVSFPVAPGSAVTWIAQAAASNGAPVEYRFWLLNDDTHTWTVLRDWHTDNTAAWTPSRAGTYHLQVWVRTVGSRANYEAWRGTTDLVVR